MVKIVITNNEEDIGIVKDFRDLTMEKSGLMGQLVMELENLKQEIILIYTSGGIDKMEDEVYMVDMKYQEYFRYIHRPGHVYDVKLFNEIDHAHTKYLVKKLS